MLTGRLVCVSEWWSEEEHRINSTLQGAARRAALCELLEQETQHIATIGLHRSAALSDTWDRGIRKFLDKVRGHAFEPVGSNFRLAETV